MQTLTAQQAQHMQAMQQVAALLTQAHNLLVQIDMHEATVARSQLDEARITVGGPCNELYYD
jgi:hypothetical protein